ncbi:MAG: zinc ABC transporter substrate-binding protein, partial [Planctomycetaceae bacterium]
DRWPEHSSAFHAGWKKLRKDWVELDERLTATHAAYRDQPLLASHPVYQYLERRYGWNLVSMHWEPDEMPEDGDWEDLQEILQDHPAGWMIWEAEPLPEIRQRLAEMGIDSVVFDPCSNVPRSGDLLLTMHDNVKQLQRIMVAEPSSSAP